MISYNTVNVKMPAIRRRDTSAWVKAVAASYGKKVGEIAYIFVDDEEILRVNREYLQHDYYTDIITFDYTEGDTISGDLFISLDTVRTNAEQFDKPYDEELHRVIIHGILHLCGINDKGPGEREIMEAAEDKALAMRGCWMEKGKRQELAFKESRFKSQGSRIKSQQRLSSQQPQAALKLESRRLSLKLETRGRSPRLKLGNEVPD